MNRRRALILALWMVCLASASIIVARAHYITDLSAFLPAKPTPAQQLLVDQLRDGPAWRLILVAIEGADAGARAQASLATASRLRRDRQFSSINNGESVTAERDRAFLFQHRYLLSDRIERGALSPRRACARRSPTPSTTWRRPRACCSSPFCQAIPPAR